MAIEGIVWTKYRVLAVLEPKCFSCHPSNLGRGALDSNTSLTQESKLKQTNKLMLVSVLQIITANPWNTIALLCGAFLALFKAAEFAKLSVKWMIKIRKRYLKRRGQATNHISWSCLCGSQNRLRRWKSSSLPLWWTEYQQSCTHSRNLSAGRDSLSNRSFSPGTKRGCFEPNGTDPTDNLKII